VKSASTRKLFAYWNALRGHRSAPERSEIEPDEIRDVLGDSFVLAPERATDYRFRLGGTRVCALFAQELKGRAFLDLWDLSSRALVRETITVIATEAEAVVAGVAARAVNGQRADLELLLLPLHDHKTNHSCLLGALTAIRPPHWLGTTGIARLTLGPMRHLRPGIETSSRSAPPRSWVRHGLTVYEGGRHSARSFPNASLTPDA
jgi:hypothetical protein